MIALPICSLHSMWSLRDIYTSTGIAQMTTCTFFKTRQFQVKFQPKVQILSEKQALDVFLLCWICSSPGWAVSLQYSGDVLKGKSQTQHVGREGEALELLFTLNYVFPSCVSGVNQVFPIANIIFKLDDSAVLTVWIGRQGSLAGASAHTL